MGRRRKHEKRHREHYRKLSKQIRDNHWSVRFIDEGRRNQIHRLASGEGEGQNSGAEKHRIVKGHHEDREKEGSLATTGMGETRRNSFRVDSTSVWSGTTATSSDWYCGQDIRTRGSIYSYDVDEGEGDEDGGRSGRSSGATSDTTTINMDQ